MFDKYRWNTYSIAEASASAILFVLILFLGKSTYHHIFFEYNYRNALNRYASEQFGPLEGALSSATYHNPSFPQIQLLQGIVSLRKNQFGSARRAFGQVIKPHHSARVRDAGRLGRAVTRIRQFDQTGTPKHLNSAESLLRRVRKQSYFAEEARVQLGVVHLRRYRQSGEKKHLNNARDAFDAVRTTLSNGGNLTRSSYEDYLSGFGDTLFHLGRPKDARKKYERLHQLNPNRERARINRAFALARTYARAPVPDSQSSEDRLRRRASFINELLHQAESRDTSLREQYRAAGVHLGLALLPVCHDQHGGGDVCDEFRTISPHLNDRETTLYNFQRIRHRLDVLQRHAQTVQTRPEQLDRKARQFLERLRSLLTSLLEQKPSAPAVTHLTSTLARTEFVLRHWHPERLTTARTLFLELLNERKVDGAALYRNLCLAFYAENEEVPGDSEKARQFGEKYLQRAEDEEFRDWFKTALGSRGGNE